MSDVVKIVRQSPNEPVPEIVDRLCELLVAAQKGEIRGLAVACVMSNGEIVGQWANSKNESEKSCHLLMAALTYLQHEYAMTGINGNEANYA